MSQLHQIRGRVGRGEYKSVCFLVSDAETEIAQARLQAVVENLDGFELAQKDLEFRGPGRNWQRYRVVGADGGSRGSMIWSCWGRRGVLPNGFWRRTLI